eukprot:TRINITY_DN11722_c0_g1_i1.p1 TRINITY_DN11722_c0_g1~~TRINITY_DN11722_c0_g1_i1.p1  ORF type:complete len:216 (+),score=45.90 TRINITY_DN11722_c0_g1_i1:29-676(+)
MDQTKSIDILDTFQIEFDVISSADGSSRVIIGDSHVISTVHGPKYISQSKSDHNDCVITIFIHDCQQNRDFSSYSEILIGILKQFLCTHLYPFTELKISCEIVCGEKCILAALLNSIYLSLLHCSFDMLKSFFAIPIQLDTCEEAYFTAIYCVEGKIVSTPNDSLVLLQGEGTFKLADIEKASLIGAQLSKSVFDFIVDYVTKWFEERTRVFLDK